MICQWLMNYLVVGALQVAPQTIKLDLLDPRIIDPDQPQLLELYLHPAVYLQCRPKLRNYP